MNRDVTLIVNTCDKYSDLWDAHVLLLEQNWGDRDMRTLLLTDAASERAYDGVEVVCAGDGSEITERLRFALDVVETPYVLVTLDDYFLVERIDNGRLLGRVETMEKEELDYLRFFNHPRLGKHLSGYGDVYEVDLSENYAVNLYPGLWRTEFLGKCLKGGLNAWEFEVSLTGSARELGARCAGTKGDEFPFMDVVRKGKLLHAAARYFDANPIYEGSREVIPYSAEIAIAVRTWMKENLPRPLLRALKSVATRFGARFYSEGV